MQSLRSRAGGGETIPEHQLFEMEDLQFAFNDLEFCDRVLHIEITTDTPNEDCNMESTPVPDDCNMESTPVPDDFKSDGCSTTSLVKVKTLNISSHLLASESAFFRKILENGMEESDQTQLTLKINASEEAALMDLLNFLYINSLSATTIKELMDVQMAADKFEVSSCMRYCSKKLPVPLDQYELHNPDPSNSSTPPSIQALKDAAKKHLIELHRDLTTFKSQEDAIVLPLSALEVVLSSNGLRVNSEEDVFDFIVKWGILHYPKPEDRREVLTKRLARFINFPYVCPLKLTLQILKCPHLDPTETWRLAYNSLQFNVGDHRLLVVDDEDDTSSTRLVLRDYKYRLVKVVYIPTPKFSCFVYFNLTKEECNKNLLGVRESVFSQNFLFGSRRAFSLVAQCRKERKTNQDCFGLYLLKHHRDGDYKVCIVDFEFGVMKRSSDGKYESLYKATTYRFVAGKQTGKSDLFGISWPELMADDSPYFVDGILHLRAHLVLNH